MTTTKPKIRTSLFSRDILHVQVPDTAADGFAEDINFYSDDACRYHRLRDGITVSAERLWEALADTGDDDDLRPSVRAFLERVLAECEKPDEYFFHL